MYQKILYYPIFGKALYKFRDKYRRQKSRLKKYYQKKKDAIDALLDEQAPSFKQSSLYPLSIWFMVMYGAKNFSKKSLIKSEENNWLQTWIDSWSQEQRTLEDEVQENEYSPVYPVPWAV